MFFLRNRLVIKALWFLGGCDYTLIAPSILKNVFQNGRGY